MMIDNNDINNNNNNNYFLATNNFNIDQDDTGVYLHEQLDFDVNNNDIYQQE
eukprot:UN09913